MATTPATAAKTTAPAPGNGAQAIKKNAQTAQKCAPNNKTGKCGFCERDGYPILPVRYAVLPNYVAASGVKPLSAVSVSYTHLTLPTKEDECRSRWSPYH